MDIPILIQILSKKHFGLLYRFRSVAARGNQLWLLKRRFVNNVKCQHILDLGDSRRNLSQSDCNIREYARSLSSVKVAWLVHLGHDFKGNFYDDIMQ